MAYSFEDYLKSKEKESVASAVTGSGNSAVRHSFDDYIAQRNGGTAHVKTAAGGAPQSLTQYRRAERELALQRLLDERGSEAPAAPQNLPQYQQERRAQSLFGRVSKEEQPKGKDWTEKGQSFLQRSPMADSPLPVGSRKDDLQLHRKVVAAAPQVIREQKDSGKAYAAYVAYVKSMNAALSAYDKMDRSAVMKLAEDGDPAAQYYFKKKSDASIESAKKYLADGGSFVAATDAYATAEKEYVNAAGKYEAAARELNDYVNSFIQAVPEDGRRQVLRDARDRDLAHGIKLSDELIATDYSNFFSAAVSAGWMEKGFEPKELLAFRTLMPEYDAAKKQFESNSYMKDGVWSIELENAQKDKDWGILSRPTDSNAIKDELLSNVYKALEYRIRLENDDAPSLGDTWDFQKATGDGKFAFDSFEIGLQEVFQLTDEERALFFYYCNKGMTNEATSLLQGLKRSLTYREGEFTADLVDYPVLRQVYATGEGMRHGLINTGRGAASLFTELDPRDTDAGQIAFGELQSRHKDSFTGLTLSTAANIGNMAPAIAGYAINPWLGRSVTFLNARGSAYDTAIENGASHWQAWGYGTLVGAAEAGLESVLGAMGGFASGKLPKEITGVFSNAAQSAAGKAMTKFGADLAGELLEENLQNYLEPAFAMLVGMTDVYDAPGMEDFIETSLVTAMSTLLLSGARMPSEIEQTKYDEQAREFAAALMKQDENGTAYRAGAQLLEALDSLEEGQHIAPAYVGAVMRSLGVNTDVSKAKNLGRAITQMQESTAVDDSPATHTVEELQNIEAYKNAVDADLVQFAEDSKSGGKANDTYQLADVKEKAASDIKAITGIDVSGFHTAIERRQIWHIFKRHGENGSANQSMSDVNDIGRLQYIIDNYDTATFGGKSASYTTVKENGKAGQAPVVLFSKKIDGTYYVAEAVPNTRRKTLYITSAFITNGAQKETGTLQLVNAPQSPVETPKASSASIPVVDSIPQTMRAVNAENGSAVYADSGLIYEALVDLGVHKAAADSLAENYDPADGLSAEIYAKGAAEAFLYGKSNFSKAEMRDGKGFSADLPELQRNTAYRLGQVFRMNQTAKEESVIQQKKAAAKQSGSAKNAQKGAVHYDGDRSRFSERQKSSVEALDKLAQALGVHFYLYESERDAAGKPIGENGWYDQKTGDIHIDLNAGELGDGTMLFTAAHELTHFLRQWSPSKFKVLSDFLVEQYAKKGQSVSDLIRNQQEKSKRNGRSLGWMQAYEEMVADSMEIMLSDGTVIEKLSELRAKDKSLVQKIRDWFKSFSAKLRSAYEGLEADSTEGRRVAEMTDAVERLQELFAEGLAQAGDNYRAAGGQKNSAQAGGYAGMRYSFRNSKTGMANDALRPYDAELRNLIESQGNIIVDSYDRLVDVVNMAFDNPKNKATAYFGILDYNIVKSIERSVQNIPQELSGNLFSRNGGYSIAVSLDAIQHMADGGKITRETAIDYLDRLADTIVEFDAVLFDYHIKGHSKVNGLLFKKKFSDGIIQSYNFVSNKKMRLNLWTLYKASSSKVQNMQQKKSATPLPMKNNSSAKTAQYNTPSITSMTQGSQTSTNSISRQAQNSNPQNNNSGETHSDRGNLTKRSVLTELDESKTKDDIERKYLRQYKEKSQLHLAEQKKLSEIRKEMDAIPEQKRHTQRARFLRDEEAKTKNRIQNYANALSKLETDSPLSPLIDREVKPFLANAVQRYGTMASGMNAARTVELPRSIDGETKVSKVARSAAEAQMTPEEFVPKIERAVAEGLLSYAPDKNADQMQRARQWVERFGDVDDAADQWIRDISGKRKLKRDDIARGILLYNNLSNAANKSENETERDRLAKRAVSMLCDLQNMATEAGQMVQAMRLMKTQQPEMQYYALQRSVLALSNKLSKQLPDGIKIDQTLAAQWMDALRNGDENAVETAKKALYRDIAAQVPKTFMDRWNAWRYLCMLGNPKTILRNLGGNIGFMPLKAVKDEIGSALEAASVKFGWMKQEDRTKYAGALFATERGRALLKFAKDDFKNVEDVASGSGKYSDGGSVSSELQKAVQEAKRKFSAPFLKQWQQGTDWAMNNEIFGDNGFLKHHYAASFAQAAAARGYSAEEIRNGKIELEQLDQMRAYALKQAQKATYRDTNAFSTALRKMHFRGNSRGATAGNVFIDGVLPFRSTPANVLVRAVEYGPVGLAKAMFIDPIALKKGDISAAEYIERLSSGLTGSMIFGLGALLRSLGVIVGGGTDEDDDRIGRQGYALEIGGVSFTLDWLAPAAIPFFMGVETQRVFEEESGVSAAAAFFNSFGTALSPMLEMSMLSGLQDMIDTVTYSGEDSTGQIMYAFFMQPFFNYLSQGIPTVSAQLANALETEDEYTYTGYIGDQLGRNFVRSLARIAEKIPGVDWRQQPYVDTYGRTQDKGNLLTRLANSFLNPMYISHLQVTEADREIERLEDATGEEISPTRRGYTVTVDGERIRLNGDQYTAYATKYGQQYAMLVGSFMASDLYAEMTDAERAEAIKEIGSVANEYGKAAAGVGYNVLKGQYKKLFEEVENGVPMELALDNRRRKNRLSAESGYENVRAVQEWEAIVGNPSLTEAQKAASLQASMTGKQKTALSACMSAGITTSQFVQITREKDRFGDGNGVWSQAELREYLDASSFSRAQKAVIWDAFGSEWKENPYK